MGGGGRKLSGRGGGGVMAPFFSRFVLRLIILGSSVELCCCFAVRVSPLHGQRSLLKLAVLTFLQLCVFCVCVFAPSTYHSCTYQILVVHIPPLVHLLHSVGSTNKASAEQKLVAHTPYGILSDESVVL